MTSLSRTHWIGGTSGSGKSTVCTLLSDRMSIPVYRADDYETSHQKQITATSHPNWWYSIHTEYMTLPADELARIYIDECRERLGLVLQDIQNSTHHELLVDDGLTEPNSLAAAGVLPNHCSFLILDAGARAARWKTERASTRNTILSRYDDPEAAWKTWMARDQLIATQLEKSAVACGMLTVTVDDYSSPTETAATSARHFGFERTG